MNKNVVVKAYRFGNGRITVEWQYLITAKPYKLKAKYTAHKPA